MFEEGVKFQDKYENFLMQIKKEAEVKREKLLSERIKSMNETYQAGIKISNIALDLLEELGFNREHAGTEYLADLVADLYHERRTFYEYDEFYDYNNIRNSHYSFINEYYEDGVNFIINCIQMNLSKSYVKEYSLNELIYGVTNDIISQYDRGSKKLVYKGKTLIK